MLNGKNTNIKEYRKNGKGNGEQIFNRIMRVTVIHMKIPSGLIEMCIVIIYGI